MASLELDDQAYANLYKELWAELDRIEHKINQLDANTRTAVFQDKKLLPAQVLCLAFESETEIIHLRQLIDELAGGPELPYSVANQLMYHLGKLHRSHNDLKAVVQSNDQQYPFGSEPDDFDNVEEH